MEGSEREGRRKGREGELVNRRGVRGSCNSPNTWHSNQLVFHSSLATAMGAILVHNENILRLCTAISIAKGCMHANVL